MADLIRVHGKEYLELCGHSVSSAHERVLRDLAECRTAALGGHVQECNACGLRKISYNSCRNRHCNKCQASRQADWFQERQADLLPVEYFHVVFTLPQHLAPIALQNKRIIYDLLFRASAETLRQVAADPRHLGAHIGFFSVLHTWGQNLLPHPHVHCVVPGGGLSPDRSRWISCPSGFFLPVKVLSLVFRGKFLDHLKRAFRNERLSFHGSLAHLSDAEAFRNFLRPLYEKKWVVYAKPPFAKVDVVIKYLARYTHRVAISNKRLLRLRQGEVTFSWKDYARGSRTRTMTLSAIEFLRRFLLHVVPKGFVRLRHYGFLANRSRATQLPLCRTLLGHTTDDFHTGEDSPVDDRKLLPENDPKTRCPACNLGTLIVIEFLKPFHSASPIPRGVPP